MDKASFSRAFHAALVVVLCISHWLFSVVQETAEYYEDLHSASIRYSKMLVALQMFALMQSIFASLNAPLFYLSRRELELIPEPDLWLLLEDFESKYLARSVRIVSIACWQHFLVESFRKDGDGFFKGGVPFLVVFIALKIVQIVVLRQEFRFL